MNAPHPQDPPSRLIAEDLERDLQWFSTLLDARFKLYFNLPADTGATLDVPPPDLDASGSAYASFLRHYGSTFAERVTLILCLATHLRPQLLDVFHTRNKTFDRKFTEFGGILDANGDFIPTGETLAFILAGTNLAYRLALPALFDREHYFRKHDVLRPVPTDADMPLMKAPLRLSADFLSYLTSGQPRQPELSMEFPARRVTTAMQWNDLVLHPGTLAQIREIEIWLRHGDTLMGEWGMAAKLRPGYRALFHGPPGTGKTITACLLGRTTGREVYKVDLSLMISKYIGETEKNLSRVFDHAQNKNWILFFDEADALFGKRTETRDSHDRYANQEVSYLLQRIETFDGITILATNQKGNIDAAFARRFESMIYFPTPDVAERARLWRQGFSAKARLAADVDLDAIAAEFELCGGTIINAIRHASLHALDQGDGIISLAQLRQGILREQWKQGTHA